MSGRAALVALVLCALGGCPRQPALIDAGPPPDAGASDAGHAFVAEVRVQKLEGTVEVRRAGTDAWQKLEVGATLQKDDTIRTVDGSAELFAGGAGGGSIVELTAGTDVKVDQLTEDLTRYLLGKGFIAADATKAGAGAGLQVNVDGTDVEVKSGDGRFNMSSNGSGTVAVAAQDGNVSVSSLGKAVVLKQGERTLVTPGKPPQEPQALAATLLLKVSWPSERETNKRRVTVTGRTAAGALVFAMGRPIAVGADGSFKAQVPLAEGDNTLDLRALDVSGNVAKEGGPRIQVDSKGAASRFKTDNLWKR